MINVAILGFGVVGSGVGEVINMNNKKLARNLNDDIAVKYIFDKREFPGTIWQDLVVHDIDVIMNDPEVDVVVECMGGAHPAYDFSVMALKAGKSVVTSNKEVVAKFGHELLSVAKENNVGYMFEASVGGGTPVIRPLIKCLVANEIDSLCGILNGTTNYILTMMNKYSESFDSALSAAQQKGYAEHDPSDDINGVDTCRKICILSDIAFGYGIDSTKVYTEGIVAIRNKDVALAEKIGSSIKLLGRARREGEKISVMVAPFIVSGERVISGIDDVFNAVAVNGNAVGEVTLCGRGAGKLPTASAMVADIVDVVNNGGLNVSWCSPDSTPEGVVMDANDVEDKYYIAFSAKDTESAKEEIVKL
ncbi:MAG: homoserine dehydrogenase, partial [Ruminococcaceae bacterium]|nr:homoserine dehydrogenase [Oscillospiraceae bacterium]